MSEYYLLTPWCILSTHLPLSLPSGLLPSGFPTKTLYTPSTHPYAPHVQPISFFSILSPAQYWVSNTNHLAPRYAVSSIPPLPLPPSSKYSPQHHVLKHPQLPFLPQYQRPSFTPIQNNRKNYSSIYVGILISKNRCATSWCSVLFRVYSVTSFIHSTEQSPSSEANQFSASQEITGALWNPKVHYH